MKAVRKCAPVPIVLLFVNILFIRNFSEKEAGVMGIMKKSICDKTYFLSVPGQNWSDASQNSEMIEIQTKNCEVRSF